MSTALVVAGAAVRRDASGLWCLNDLHRAAGGKRSHGPSLWLANQQTRELIGELTDTGNPVSVVRGGRQQGTYVCDDLVYAYAMWISAKFCLKVIRAYRDATGQDIRLGVSLMNQRLALEMRDASSKARGSLGGKLMNERRREKPRIDQERTVLNGIQQPELFT